MITRRIFLLALLVAVAAAWFLCMTGCAVFGKRPQIRAGDVSVTGLPDAGKPATLGTSQSGESLPLPAGSRIIETKTDAVPAKAATAESPAVPAQPARTVTEIIPGAATVLQRTESTVHADTGTVDTSIAAHKIDAAESRPLLYAAIVAAAAAGFFVWRAYPTPALACGIASAVFFLAWKVSGLPDWFWAIGLLAAGVAGALYIGHEKGEVHAFLNPPKPPSTS